MTPLNSILFAAKTIELGGGAWIVQGNTYKVVSITYHVNTNYIPQSYQLQNLTDLKIINISAFDLNYLIVYNYLKIAEEQKKMGHPLTKIFK